MTWIWIDVDAITYSEDGPDLTTAIDATAMFSMFAGGGNERRLMVCATCKKYCSHTLSADEKSWVCKSCGAKTKVEKP